MKALFIGAGDNIFKFIKVIYNEARGVRQKIYRLGAGEPVPGPDPVVVARNAAIVNVHRQYGERDEIDFLRGIAPNIRLGQID